MSEQNQDPTISAADTDGAQQSPPLTDLMASGTKAERPAVDLDQEALRAAERAISEGSKALATANEEIAAAASRRPRGNRVRETVLRLLLIGNVVAMVVVALLPTPAPKQADHPSAASHDAAPRAPAAPHAAAPQLDDPWSRALVAANRREWGTAIEILEQYLADNPRMPPSQRLSTFMAIGYYASRLGNVQKALDYQRKADAIEQSHKLPEDLVAEAQAAAANGDQESLRSIWARFLLQQRQVPSWLYKHVAEAYLQLGDSYRAEANAAAEAERVRQLEESAAKLRAERLEERGGK